ncbi:MAG TPA: hypothetical protein VJT49_23275 [Amycolatopsis sp.]|uniref:hypothetical protein n=1 Tax=Amycolatopsis sp. TaxID=37632 RepID=UPI002B4A5DDB|nr:hypothetical protein [Amycolatopsis sp.]HKS47978.1 hypothetical protein [Amycolatopsis sp.]
MTGGTVVNVIVFGVVSMAPAAAFWVVGKAPRIVRAVGRWCHRRPPVAEGPPIERLAADLRRVHRQLARMAADAPVVRRRAANQAYDALLTQACRAVGVAHRLDTVPDGIEREIERLRVEDALRQSGLAVP